MPGWQKKELLHRAKPTKAFVSGEGFPYLGRHHRLLLVAAQQVPVKLEAGRLRMRRADAQEGQRHLRNWYAERATDWLRRRVRLWAPRVGKTPASIVVTRSGLSLGLMRQGRPRLLPLEDHPAAAARHRIRHRPRAGPSRRSPPHPAFWTRVERALPDFATRKRWLLENAAEWVEL